jgi:hypothetical protein
MACTPLLRPTTCVTRKLTATLQGP